jgi:lysophospholipase L1-like esterase
MPFHLLIQILLTLIFQQPMENKRTFLALGDSYTIGEAVAESERWPVQFVNRMNASGKSFKMPEIIAKTGWTTDELQQAIEAAKPNGPYDMVSLLIGVNNQYRGNSIEVYKKEFIELVEQALVFSGSNPKHVVIVSIPDWGVTPFAEGRDRAKIAQEIDLFNSINREIAQSYGITYVDITSHSRNADTETDLVASDKLHPSGKMYTFWAGRVFVEMKDRY